MTFLTKRAMFHPLKQRGCFWMEDSYIWQGKFIYIAHFIHSGNNTKVLYIKSEIIIHSNKNKELKIIKQGILK